jgi:long-chain acyl-CoA synthetase
VQFKFDTDNEILLRGSSIFTGYLDRPDATAQAFTEDGWFRTGDIGQLDDDGYMRITDRKKNLIKTAGGKYVVPAKLEALLKEEPMVSQVYVHGDRRPYVIALITLDDREAPRVAEELGVKPSELPSHPEINRRVQRAVDRANEHLARYEQIKSFSVLPEDFSVASGMATPTLKIKRKVVAERYADRIEALYTNTTKAHKSA